jgi:hypothetical protein
MCLKLCSLLFAVALHLNEVQGNDARRHVSDGDELATALQRQETELVLSGAVQLSAKHSVVITKPVVISGRTPASILVLSSESITIKLAGAANLTLKGLTVAQWAPSGRPGVEEPDSPAQARKVLNRNAASAWTDAKSGPLFRLDASEGRLIMEDVVLHSVVRK